MCYGCFWVWFATSVVCASLVCVRFGCGLQVVSWLSSFVICSGCCDCVVGGCEFVLCCGVGCF